MNPSGGFIVDYQVPSTINLQMNLASASAMSDEIRRGHHPITCKSELRLEDDGRFTCEHWDAPPGDVRTQACIDHSVSMLLFELLREKVGP